MFYLSDSSELIEGAIAGDICYRKRKPLMKPDRLFTQAELGPAQAGQKEGIDFQPQGLWQAPSAVGVSVIPTEGKNIGLLLGKGREAGKETQRSQGDGLDRDFGYLVGQPGIMPLPAWDGNYRVEPYSYAPAPSGQFFRRFQAHRGVGAIGFVNSGHLGGVGREADHDLRCWLQMAQIFDLRGFGN